jgi:hypothetical protein
MNKTTTRRIHVRGLISLLTAMSFLIMSISGIVLFIVPQGRIANWIDWRFIALSKAQWGDMHITTSLLFILAVSWHIVLNWRSLLNHFRDRAKRTVALKGELVAAGVLTLFVTFGSIYSLPPLSYLLDLNAFIKTAWINGPQDEPVVSHAELLSLRAFAAKLAIEPAAALAELKKNGVLINSADEKLADIARLNQSSPAGIYRHLEALEKAARPVELRWTAQLVEDRFEGKGMGKKTLVDICKEVALEPRAVISKLAGHGITAKPDDTLRELADARAEGPMDMLKRLLDGESVHAPL